MYTIFKIVPTTDFSNLQRVDDVLLVDLVDIMHSKYDAAMLRMRVVNAQHHFVFAHITATARHEYIAVPHDCVVDAVAMLMQYEQWPKDVLC